MDTDSNTTQSPVLEHVEIVPEAAKTILLSTAGIEFEVCGDDDHLYDDGVVIALISLVGDVDWSIFLGLPRQTASSVAAKFAGFEIPFESDDMGDAIGELTNILAGQVKFMLDQRGVKANISLPSVMRAESMTVLIRHETCAEKRCFTSPLGKLWTGVVVGKDHRPGA